MSNEQQLREWAEIAGINIGNRDAGPYPTLEQLAQFAALSQPMPEVYIKPWKMRLEEQASRTPQGHIHTSVEEVEELMQAEIDELRAALSLAPTSAPEVALQESPLVDMSEEAVIARCLPQPQAQGEPEVVAWMSPGKEQLQFARKDTVYGSHTLPLITLQSHREAMADIDEMNRQLREQNEAIDAACAKLERAIANRDAALVACVEALQEVRVLVPDQYETKEHVDAAITQAQEALK